jgi:hypothetical protein
MSKKKEGREIPALLEYLSINLLIYALDVSPISSTSALTDLRGIVDISIL